MCTVDECLICRIPSGYNIHYPIVCIRLVLPPLMVYRRTTAVPDSNKNGSFCNTLFQASKNGWINSDIFLDWLKLFISNIPPT